MSDVCLNSAKQSVRAGIDRGAGANQLVKAEITTKVLAIPMPTHLSPVPVKRVAPTIDDLKEEIFAELKKSRSHRGLRSVIDEEAVSRAHKLNDIAMLEAMLVCAAESTPALSEVITAYRLLQCNMIPTPEIFLTPAAVNFTHRLMFALLKIQGDRPKGNEVPIDELRCFALTADMEDYPLIKRAIVERSITDLDAMKAMVAEMKMDATALSDGKL